MCTLYKPVLYDKWDSEKLTSVAVLNNITVYDNLLEINILLNNKKKYSLLKICFLLFILKSILKRENLKYKSLSGNEIFF